MNNISDDALLVLRAVSEQPLEGYQIMGRTSLTVDIMTQAIETLEREQLVRVRRTGSVSDIGEAVVYVPPTARNEVNRVMGRVSKY